MRRPPVLAIVVPCYNEEEVFPVTCGVLRTKLDELVSRGKAAPDSLICFVDDGSTDRTWRLVEAAHAEDPRVKGIRFSGNRGHQYALLAGLECVRDLSDAAVSLDADLQDDVGVLERFVDRYLEGHDIVYGVRKRRDTDSRFKKWTALLFYKLMAVLGVRIVYNHADYRLADRKVLEALTEHRERNLFLRGIFPSLGFRSAVVEYDRQERTAGASKYSLRRMLSFALEGVTSFSVVPLRIVTFMGLAAFLVSVVLTVWAFWQKYTGHTIPGWSSLIISLYFIGAVQLLSVGLIGEYIGKIYREVKARPRYIIHEKLF